MDTYRNQLESFTLATLPDLDVVTLGALERFAADGVPAVARDMFTKPLVIGSVNAAETGKIIFADQAAVFANQDSYERMWRSHPDIDGAIIVSASGSKHAVSIVQTLTAAGVPTVLLTTDPNAPAAAHLPADSVYVFPRNREPYTYNTSTYLGMIFGARGEDPAAIRSHIETQVAPMIPQHFGEYDAFFCMIPPEFGVVRGMLRTKFDELFGSRVCGRVFTYEEAKHAKTVVPYERECFVSFGVENDAFGDPARRVRIPLPDAAGPAALMAVGYYTIGHIQKQHPPYFKEHIAEYAREASRIFGTTISPIVE